MLLEDAAIKLHNKLAINSITLGRCPTRYL